MAITLANAFALLGDDDEQDIEAEEHKKFAAQEKKRVETLKRMAEELLKFAQELKQKMIAAVKKKHGNYAMAGAGQRYFDNGDQRNGTLTIVLCEEDLDDLIFFYESLFAGQVEYYERLLATEARREERRLEKQQKADKSTSLSVPESTPLREAATLRDDFQTKQKPRGRGTEDSRKSMNNGNYKAGYSKPNQDNPLPHEDKTVEVKAEPAAALDLSETNFPVLRRVTNPTKSFVKHGRKD